MIEHPEGNSSTAASDEKLAGAAATTSRIDPVLSDRFSAVFNSRLWGEGETLSGPGSRLDNPMVIKAFDAIDYVVEQLGVRSIADIPCGDFNWFQRVLRKHSHVDYAGFDIVEPLIELNRGRFEGVKFAQFDIVSDVPPGFDLIFTKELFIHLRDQQVLQAIRNMKASGSIYLMASNSFGVENVDLAHDELGYARPVDLCVEPFSLPTPMWRNDFYALWRLAEI